MADYIKNIRTSDGDKQIDYTALANLPGNATASAAGLMSPADKSKLDGISSGADSVSFTQSLTSGTKIGTLTINGTGTDLYCPTGTATGVLPVDKGGTGADNAAGARQNLGITPQNIGAMPLSGGTMTDSIRFKGNVVGLVWETENGTVFSMRPYAAGNILQITTNGPDTENAEQPTFNITSGGHMELHHALAVTSGGTGAKDAAGARANLGITPANIGAAPASHNHSAGNITSGVIPIVRGGTGASDAAAARANLGALATSGGPITGYLQFGTMSNGLEWFTADGTQIHLRPYTPGNSFQITLKGPNTDDQETGAFNISTTGYVTLGRPLGIESGGTGANSAAGARNNLSVPELRNSVVIVNNQKGIGTGVSAGQYWQLWNLQNGSTYPVGLVPSENGTQYLGQNGYRIKAVYANDYPCGTWNGNAIAVAKGGTGATSAAGARANLGIGVADTASGTINYTKAGQQVNFGKTLSKVPIVICIQNGGDFANYKVGNITRTGFTISASATGTTWQYVALCV